MTVMVRKWRPRQVVRTPNVDDSMKKAEKRQIAIIRRIRRVGSEADEGREENNHINININCLDIP